MWNLTYIIAYICAKTPKDVSMVLGGKMLLDSIILTCAEKVFKNNFMFIY